MKLYDYVVRVMETIKPGTTVEFELSLDAYGNVVTYSSNRIRFTVVKSL